MKKVIIELLEINELEKEAKNIAIEQHRDFLVESYSDDMFDDCFNMTRSKYAESLTIEEIIEHIEINEYLFFPNGELANTILYCGRHPEAGKHILNLFDNEYDILNSID